MSDVVRILVGVLLVVVGGIWFGQGMGWIGGSGMSGETLWAVVGPVVALVGVWLAVTGLRARRTKA
ncbi:hypothetical protein ACPPVT_18865 [Angustibacter sp. McL0619]|uniref:hypothetical protein n=1 Tax=Angustibacter sp. McL0619 TaxID=3415676 RepID=UPI003CF8C2DD